MPDPEPPGDSLDHLAIGACGRVLAVGGDDHVRRRLLEMGLCPGVVVEVLRRAPLGDPIELRVRGYLLSVRADHARHVAVAVAVAGGVIGAQPFDAHRTAGIRPDQARRAGAETR